MPSDPATYNVTLTPLQTLLLASLLELPALPLALTEPPDEPDEQAVNDALDQLVAQDYAQRPAEDTLTLNATVVSILQRVASAPVMLTVSAFAEWKATEARFHIAPDLAVMQSQTEEGETVFAALRDADVLRESLTDVAPLPEEEPAGSERTLTPADIQAAFGLVPDATLQDGATPAGAQEGEDQLDANMTVARLDLYERAHASVPGEWRLTHRLAWLTSQDRLWRAVADGSDETLLLVPASPTEISASWQKIVRAATEGYAPYTTKARKVADYA